MGLKNEDLTGKIIKAFYAVYNELGFGFLEKVYEKSFALELMSGGVRVCRQQPIKVYYRGREVGVYFADLLVENLVIIEVKSADALCDANEAQLINYLKATEIETGLLLNFGPKPSFRRKIFTNDMKRHRLPPPSQSV